MDAVEGTRRPGRLPLSRSIDRRRDSDGDGVPDLFDDGEANYPAISIRAALTVFPSMVTGMSRR